MPENNFITLFVAVTLVLAGCAETGQAVREPGQVFVCHNGNSITVSNPDYLRHIEHGDSAGPCAN